MKYLVTILFFLLNHQLYAQDFVFTQNCKDAYQNMIAMKVNDGKKLLVKELLSNKNNLLPIALINYEDFISLSFNENPALYKEEKKQLQKRLDMIEKGNQKSPYYLFCKAQLYFQWSIIQIKYADYFNAVWDFRKAYLLFKENQKKFPTFHYHNIYIGLQEAVISTIPNGYKWATNILGLKGNMKNGLQLLRNFIASNDPLFREEAQFYYIYLKNYLENNTEEANQLIKQYQLDTKNNQLFVFMAANLALNNKNAQLSEAILQQRKTGAEYLPFPMLDYELADAKMKRLDLMNAIKYHQKFIASTQGNFYVKDANYSIALCYYLLNDMKQANVFIQKVITQGKTEADADKQALKNAKKGKFPNAFLLKARLLNDGGYNNEALKILQSISVNVLPTEAEKLEYTYRFARIYDDMLQDDKALQFYNHTIREGANSTEYFAARACLQAGYIYEKKGMKQKAIEYYQMLLNLGEHEYKNSLDQRAKSSLNRLK